jgi:signal transduction histidine kinase
MRWFACGAVLAAFGRVNYALFPSRASQWVYTGDFFRLAFYLVLLAGAARAISEYQRALALAAAADERRRVARNLHDGLAHELLFILSTARAVAASGSHDRVHQLVSAAERALDESRRAIAVLARAPDEDLDVAIAQAAEEVGGRLGMRVAFQLDAGVRVGAERQEELVRIVREAVTNAGRHGKASRVTVRLVDDGGLRLRIVDDGVGFDARLASSADGFGLTSMRERARRLAGVLTIESAPGRGTVVEVVVPQ